MNRPGETELARLLRADVPPLGDAQFVLTLAEVARSSATLPIRRRVRTSVKVGAIAASVAITTFGAAYASDLFSPAPPTHSNPSSPGTDEPTDGERESRGPRNPDESVDVRPSPATGTKSSEPDGVPAEADTPDATAPAGSEQEPSLEGPAPEDPPASDSGPGDDDSGDDDAGPGDDESQDESEPEDDPAPDDDSGDDPDDPETDSDPDDDSGEPEPGDESESPDDD